MAQLPFFAPSTVPQPPVIVLLSDTNVVFPQLQPVLAHQDVRISHSSPRHHPYKRGLSLQPSSRPKTPRHASVHVEDPDDSSVSSSPSTSSRQSTPAPTTPQSTRTINTKIKRPKGAGRIDIALIVDWPEAVTEAVKAKVKELANEYLDMSRCFTDQEEEQKEKVRREMVKAYPMLDDYVNVWPVNCALQRVLKYSSLNKMPKKPEKRKKGRRG